MAVVVVASAKGSPGVTTAALAFTLSWGRRTVLAECDPAGGSVLAGYLRSQLPAERGMLPLAIAELRDDALARDFWAQLIDLDAPHRRRLLLAGITSPVQAATLAPMWDRFARFFAECEFADPACDVIVDCGRLAAAPTPWPLIRAADAVLLAVRPTLASLSAVMPAVESLKKELTDHVASTSSLGLLLIGDGPYDATEIGRTLAVPVIAVLPDDPRTADTLSNGGVVRSRSPLMRAAAGAESSVRALIGRHRQLVPRRVVLSEVRHGAV
jgi:cellulose biosynthesis protein BcsQ